MKSIMLDRTRLSTVSNYAKKSGVTRATIYNWAKNGEVDIVELDGVMFVYD